jgi:hypothetical protein
VLRRKQGKAVDLVSRPYWPQGFCNMPLFEARQGCCNGSLPSFPLPGHWWGRHKWQQRHETSAPAHCCQAQGAADRKAPRSTWSASFRCSAHHTMGPQVFGSPAHDSVVQPPHFSPSLFLALSLTTSMQARRSHGSTTIVMLCAHTNHPPNAPPPQACIERGDH